MTKHEPMNPEQLKDWARDNASLAYSVLMARAFAQTERARVDAYINPIFETYGFTYAEKWIERGRPAGLIAKREDLYLSDDEPQIAHFYAACDAAHRAHGFTGPAGHCPALVAEHLVRQAERLLVELAEPIAGLTHHRLLCSGLDKLHEYVEMLIKLCVSTVPRTADEVLAGIGVTR